MVEAVLRAKGLYSLTLTARTSSWKAELPGGRWAAARQLQDGSVLVRASCEESVAQARFLLALDDDTSEFHRRFARDPLLGPSVRNLRGLRTTRTPTVAHAALRAVCGQLIQSRRARDRTNRDPGMRREPADTGGAREPLARQAHRLRARRESCADAQPAHARSRSGVLEDDARFDRARETRS